MYAVATFSIILLYFDATMGFLPLLNNGLVRKARVESQDLWGKPSVDDLDPNVGYGAFGSLTRQGLVPYVIRVVKPDTYAAAVAKYAAKEKCSKLEAMANMDAYFADPNGWAGDKLREKNGGKKRDYINVNQNPFSLALTALWAVGISGLGYRIFEINVLNK